MMTSSPPTRPQVRGFTIVELMVATVVLSILCAIAFPSFLGSIRKGRRAEAYAALAVIQQAQERWRGNHATYASLADLQTVNGNILATTPNGHYAISIDVATAPDDATTYTATATAQGGQANDSVCPILAVRTERGNISYGSGSTAPDWGDPGRCWAK